MVWAKGLVCVYRTLLYLYILRALKIANIILYGIVFGLFLSWLGLNDFHASKFTTFGTMAFVYVRAMLHNDVI